MNYLWLWRFLILWQKKGDPAYFSINLYQSDCETLVHSVGYDAYLKRRWWVLGKVTKP